MKKIILFILILSSSAYAGAATPAAATTATVAQAPAQELKVNVKGMVCAFCAQGIEKNFKSQPEVADVEVSLENKFVKLKFKPGQALAQDKISQILKDAGYEASFGQ